MATKKAQLAAAEAELEALRRHVEDLRRQVLPPCTLVGGMGLIGTGDAIYIDTHAFSRRRDKPQSLESFGANSYIEQQVLYGRRGPCDSIYE